MPWVLVERIGKSHWIPGQFSARRIKNFLSLPIGLKGRGYNWYVDSKERIAKLQFEPKSAYKLGEHVSLPKTVKEGIRESESVIAYMDKDAIYLASKDGGQERLTEFLAKEKVL